MIGALKRLIAAAKRRPANEEPHALADGLKQVFLEKRDREDAVARELARVLKAPGKR